MVEPIAGEADGVRWSVLDGRPHPGLDGLVVRYSDYTEHSRTALRRRQVATPGVTVILSYGDPLRLEFDGGPAVEHRSFVAGIHDACVITEYQGPQGGMQVDLTPIGAHRLLGVPMRHLTNERIDTAALDVAVDLVELTDRLAHAATRVERFAVVDEVLLAAAATGPVVRPETAWAWRQLQRTGGLVSVNELADEIGWSRRHLIRRFGEEIGLSPKPVARLLRFSRAVDLFGMLAQPGPVPDGGPRPFTISDVAATTGYADHSHLVREFRRLAGCSPSAYLADLTAAGHGAITTP